MSKVTKIIIVIGVFLAVLVAVFWRPESKPAATATAPKTPVKIVKVGRQDVPLSVSGIGTVLSLRSVTIRPQVDGVLTKILVKEGQHVQRGQLLATLDDRSLRAALDQANAALAQTQAQLHVAAINLRRYAELSKDDGISKQTFDQQQAQVEQLKATVLGDQATIAAAQVQLSYTQIHAPSSGRVGIRNVDEGNFLRVADAQGLFSVTQIDPIGVEFALPQEWLPTLQTLIHETSAAKVSASTANPASDRPAMAEGQLTLIDNQISASTGTIRAKAEFANDAERLWPGQLVTIKLQTGLKKDALVVPPTVVQRGLEGHFVYRVKHSDDSASTPTVEVIPVDIVYQNSDLAIVNGVAAGDEVVSDGQSRLKAGAAIRVITADAEAAGKAAVEHATREPRP